MHGRGERRAVALVCHGDHVPRGNVVVVCAHERAHLRARARARSPRAARYAACAAVSHACECGASTRAMHPSSALVGWRSASWSSVHAADASAASRASPRSGAARPRPIAGALRRARLRLVRRARARRSRRRRRGAKRAHRRGSHRGTVGTAEAVARVSVARSTRRAACPSRRRRRRKRARRRQPRRAEGKAVT